MLKLGGPAIIKTRRFGYDGKGQKRLTSQACENLIAGSADQRLEILKGVGAGPYIAEGFVNFDYELSVVAAMTAAGEFAAYDPAINEHRDGILKRSIAPANAPENVLSQAITITKNLMTALNYVGVIAVEFFVTDAGELLVNEYAPRVHNSGHWTMDACACGQFEQHIRAICGWPLGSTIRHSNAVMTNLIGNDADGWRQWAETPNACLHLYGKTEPRPGRKMGHVTEISPIR